MGDISLFHPIFSHCPHSPFPYILLYPLTAVISLKLCIYTNRGPTSFWFTPRTRGKLSPLSWVQIFSEAGIEAGAWGEGSSQTAGGDPREITHPGAAIPCQGQPLCLSLLLWGMPVPRCGFVPSPALEHVGEIGQALLRPGDLTPVFSASSPCASHGF